MIGVTEFAYNELSKDFNNALYLTNGVDKNFISQKEKSLIIKPFDYWIYWNVRNIWC